VELALEPPAPDATVTLDSRPVPSAMLGIRRPIDPGSHTIEVQRAGAAATRRFSIKEAESQRIVVAVPGSPAPEGGYAPPPPAEGAPVYYPPAPGAFLANYRAPPPVVMRRRSTALFVTGVILIPVATIGGIAGAVVGGINENAPAVYASLGVGLVGIGGGIAMAVIGGRKVPVDAPPAGVSFEPLIGPTSMGLRVRF
jgi:hypothetical protein